MKKLIAGIIAGILITLTATSYAASIIKSVYFNDNVKLQVNGKLITTEILTATKEGQINGSNYVSARALAEAMGGAVDWKNNTVIVTSNLQPNDIEIDTLKLYSRIADEYKILDDLGTLINMTSDGLAFSAREIILTKKIDKYQDVYDVFNNKTISLFNTSLSGVVEIQKESQQMGIDLTDMSTILNNYRDALDQYSLAFLNLIEFASTSSNTDLANHTSASDDAYKSCVKGSTIAQNGYSKYYNIIQSGKSISLSPAEGTSYKYYELLSYLYILKDAISNESVVANNQFHMNLGILKFPGDSKYETATLQANRREAKSEFILKYFTEENYRYKDIDTNCLPSEIIKIKNIKEKVTDGFDCYIKAANERGFDNPKDYYSIDTDFWKLKGKGNIAMDDAQGLIEDFLRYIDILVASGTAQ